ncbi:Sec-independent protein translocase TatC [Halomarina ordinaria]|uniref:Sec-independent protein translocase protein TatC n=1 Tax=Halomarina ordinaria TaxID=3033939 RepID=A0ABD5UF68_9EURY|nr:Sec-independent protein translocase TatC [Halomarina sp. PSRA2]
MSSVVNEDTARAIDDGRAALGAVLRAAQKHLQKVFILFVVGLMGTIYYLQEWGWTMLKADLLARSSEDTIIVAVTPFDVILLQVKIGLVVGVLLALPLLLYFSRDAFRKRGWWPEGKIPVWKGVILGSFSLGLFALGVAYGYFLFFPIMFEFLSNNASAAGFEPTYSIVKWAEFVLVLTLSFGLAAQLPLAMSGLAYSGVVRYETFREKWRYAVVAIFVFGALFSPPDPFTQIMWAVPLLFLYVLSLWFTKVVVTLKHSRDSVGFRRLFRAHWHTVLGSAVLAGAVTYYGLQTGVREAVNEYTLSLPADYAFAFLPIETVLGLPREQALVVAAVAVGSVAALVVFFVHLSAALKRLTAETGPVGAMGDPTAIDLATLDAAGVRAAPPEVFAELSEDETLEHARAAMAADDGEKAQAILDRFDDAETAREAEAETEADREAEEEDAGVVTRTTTGMFNAFSEEERDEDDIGGYFYDIQFVAGTLLSKSFRLVAVFLVVMAGTFLWFYTEGIGQLRDNFLARIPEVVRPEVSVVTLHPVEALIFEIKVATILGAIATLPLLLYYAWPALKERGVVTGSRGALFTWATTTAVALVAGSALGYFVVAPNVISWLAWDAIDSNMIIRYRINSAGWLVFFTTIGVGLLASIPSSMFLLHRAGLVPFRVMRGRWREVVVAVLTLTALATPGGVFAMFLFTIPIAIAYFVGLALLWLYTLGGRRGGRPRGQRVG